MASKEQILAAYNKYANSDPERAQAIKAKFPGTFTQQDVTPELDKTASVEAAQPAGRRRRKSPVLERNKRQKAFRGEVDQYKTQIDAGLDEATVLDGYNQAGSSGDKALMIALEEMYPDVAKPPSKIAAGLRALRGGLSFNFDDEIAGLVMGDDVKEEMRQQQGIDATRRPLASRTGAFAGALGPGGALGLAAKGLKATSVLGKAGKLSGLGAAEGATLGAGGAADLESTPIEALKGAALGGALGGAASLGGSLAGGLKTRFSAPSRSKAAIAEKMTPEDIQASKESLQTLPQGATLADTNPSLSNIGAAQVLKGTPEGVKATKMLTERRDASGAGVVQKIDDSFGTGNVQNKIKDLQSTAKTEAEPLYKEAMASKVSPSQEMNYILDNDKLSAKAWSEAIDQVARREFKTTSKKNIRDGARNNLQVWDRWKKIIDGKIGKASRQGDNAQVSELSNIKNTVLEELDTQVPVYKEARSVYAGSKASEEAVEAGRKVFSGDMEQVAEVVTPGNEQFFKLGVAKAARDKVKNVKDKADKSSVLVGSEGLRDRLKLAFGDEVKADEFITDLQGRSVQHQAAQNVLEGSKTAKMMFEGGLDIPVNPAAPSTSNISKALTRVVRGDTRKTADEVVKALYETDLMKNEDFLDDLIKVLQKQQRQTTAGAAVTAGEISAGTAASTIDENQ